MSDISKKQATCRGLLVTWVTSPSYHGWSDQGHTIVSIALSPQAVLERWAHRRYTNVRRRLLHRDVNLVNKDLVDNVHWSWLVGPGVRFMVLLSTTNAPCSNVNSGLIVIILMCADDFCTEESPQSPFYKIYAKM